MSQESWKTFFEIGGVGLLFLTFVFGAGALITTRRINERQAQDLRQFEMALEVQRERTFRAEATLKELEKGKWPRMLSSEGFEILKGKPTATAEIMYKADDPEAALFASSIFGALTSFGWRVSRPTPIPATIQADQILSALQAGPLGVTMTIKSIPLDINHPYQQLARALSKSTAGGPGQLSRDPSLPDNLIRIIVMQKP